MHCPFCASEDTRVADSRLVEDGDKVRRRRVCQTCGARFSTYEAVDFSFPRVIKSDGSRENYNPGKIRRGVLRSLEKRPVDTEYVDILLSHVKKRMLLAGEKEIKSKQIGEWVLHELKDIDEVAYVRFASVYRSFEDVNEFREMIEKLEDETMVNLSKDQMQLLPERK